MANINDFSIFDRLGYYGISSGLWAGRQAVMPAFVGILASILTPQLDALSGPNSNQILLTATLSATKITFYVWLILTVIVLIGVVFVDAIRARVCTIPFSKIVTKDGRINRKLIAGKNKAT